MQWKARFDAEMALQRAKLEGEKIEDRKNRLTGKQWFLQQEAQHIEVGAAGRRCSGLGFETCEWLVVLHGMAVVAAAPDNNLPTVCPSQIEEPELEADEEDGEDDRENWAYGEVRCAWGFMVLHGLCWAGDWQGGRPIVPAHGDTSRQCCRRAECATWPQHAAAQEEEEDIDFDEEDEEDLLDELLASKAG